jgi:L-threonylcarbamoyladenylate synthase
LSHAGLTHELEQAVTILRRGGLVAFPTETVYGLGADANNAAAIRKLYAAKGRPVDHPVIVHIAGMAQLPQWAREVTPIAQKLAQRFWPGPLTMILKRAPGVSDAVTGGQDTVGIRIPAHAIAHALLEKFGGGVAAPSANRFGRVSATTAEHVRREFGDAVDFVFDGGQCDVGIESTIVDVTGAAPALLRPGHVTARDIELAAGVALAMPTAQSPRAPGTLAAHYAPATPLLVMESDLLLELAATLTRQGKRVAVLARSARQPVATGITWIAAPPAAHAYAHDLYANLRVLDALGCDALLVEQLPERPEWAAVNDRLGRAAAGSRPPSAF